MTLMYAGIGGRASPLDVLHLMRLFGAYAALEGYSLNTGGADGADHAFESGARLALPVLALRSELNIDAGISVFLPWEGFNGYTLDTPGAQCLDHPDTVALVRQHHPAGDSLKPAVLNLMRRNCHQVLGHDLETPVKFVLCWTPDGATHGDHTSASTGGTGFAIRLASAAGIPVFNLQRPDHRQRIQTWVDTLQKTWLEQGIELTFPDVA